MKCKLCGSIIKKNNNVYMAYDNIFCSYSHRSDWLYTQKVESDPDPDPESEPEDVPCFNFWPFTASKTKPN